MRKMSPAQSAASSPPTPWRISTITSLRSAGSVSTSASFSSSSSARAALLELRHELAQVAVAARGLEVVADLAPLLRQLVRPFELLHAAADLRGLAVVVVDGRVAQALLRLAVRALQLVDQLFEAGHLRKGSADGRSGDRRSRGDSCPVRAAAAGALAALRRPGFRRVYLAVATSELGDSFHYIALMWAALLAGGPLGVIAVRLADSLPALVFGFHGGLLADRAGRKRLMVGADLVRAARSCRSRSPG